MEIIPQRQSRIRRGPHREIFVFIEEHPDSINDGYFLNKVQLYEWFDLPASWHGGAGALTFADGHTETHRWRDAVTLKPNRPDSAMLPFTLPSGQRNDYSWLRQRTSTYDHVASSY